MKKAYLILTILLIMSSFLAGCQKSNEIIGYYNEKDLEAVSRANQNSQGLKVYKNKIRQIKTDEGIKGSGGGFLVFGLNIETSLYFAMYIENGDSLRLFKIPASQTTIYEDAEEDAYVVSFDIIDMNMGLAVSAQVPFYILHVPKNSISPNISMDL